MTETKTAHTLGPWKCEVGDRCLWIYGPMRGETGDHIARSVGDPESDANRRLIAAAPELLALLKRVRDEQTLYDPDGPYVVSDTLDAILAAIAKVESQ